MSSGRTIPGQTPPAAVAPRALLRDGPAQASFPSSNPSSSAGVTSDPAWTHSAPASPATANSASFPGGRKATALPALGSPQQPVRGQSEPLSQVVQAQFTSSDTPLPPASATSALSDASNTVSAADDSTSDSGDTKQPRALKPRSSAKGATQEKRSTGTAQMIVSVGSSLLIVIGLLLGAAWCYRRASPHTTGNLPKQVVQVLGRTPLAPRQQLVLLRFGTKLVLVSNLQGEVRTVSEIDDPLEVDRVAGLCESSQAGSITDSFRSVLHNIGRSG